MTQPDTLHTRLRAEIERRLAVARAAGPAWANIGAVVEAGDDGVPFVASDYGVDTSWVTTENGLSVDSAWWPVLFLVVGLVVCFGVPMLVTAASR